VKSAADDSSSLVHVAGGGRHLAGALPSLRQSDVQLVRHLSKSFYQSGTHVMILKIFSPKNVAKNLAIFAQSTASLCKNLIVTLLLRKRPLFRRKLTKIMITPLITVSSSIYLNQQ
jgi:DUF1365 family protein